MYKKLIMSVAALGLSTGVALADGYESSGYEAGGYEAANAGAKGDYFFGQIDYSINIKTDVTSESAPASVGSAAYTGGMIDEFDSSWGVGIGYRYANNVAAIVRYEEASTSSDPALRFVDVNGSSQTRTVTDSGDTDITNIMLEAAYFMPYSEKVEFFVLGGLGRAEIETQDLSVTTFGLVGCGDQETSTSYRLGAGATYEMTRAAGFYAGVTYTNYGDLAAKNVDSNQNCSVRSGSQDVDIESQDLRIGYYINF
ncbi:outer membrane beta-barrel protein [Alphaproteobacteria bacterium]|jgi:opacity protein-like surface antigen|nr:outer membrane beta-barrel protein [Alphaproteobacteria bacterium]